MQRDIVLVDSLKALPAQMYEDEKRNYRRTCRNESPRPVKMKKFENRSQNQYETHSAEKCSVRIQSLDVSVPEWKVVSQIREGPDVGCNQASILLA
jgi:hypothetical protein